MNIQSILGLCGGRGARPRSSEHRLAILGATILILASGRDAHANNYTITVDASKQTAGNPRFWAASVGTGTAALTLRSDLQTHYKLGNREIGFQRVRGHG